MTGALDGLAELARQEAERTGLETQLDVARQQQVLAAERCDAAAAKLAGELADVGRLESMSMTRILAGLKGTRDSDLSREQAEAEAAQYAVAEADAREAAAERAVVDLEGRIAALGDLSGRRAALLAQREDEIAADPGAAETARQLTGLAERLGEGEAEAAQLAEALAAANRARQALGTAQQHLGSAGSWATYDTFFGGGMLADAMKHDKLDRAGHLMREADAALAHLATELADVGIGAVGEVGITQLTKVLDVWFDNIFSDWAVRDRIQQAAARVDELVASVDAVGDELVRRRDASEAERASLLAERESLLLA